MRKVRRVRKGQASMEFVIMVVFAIVFLSVLAGAFFTQMKFIQDGIIDKQVSLIGDRILKAVEFAARSDASFFTVFDLPVTVAGQEFNWIFEQGGDYLIINTSLHNEFLPLPSSTIFVLGDSARYCVSSLNGNITFANQVISVVNNKLFLGCMENLNSVTLMFSSLNSISLDLQFPFNQYNVNLSRSGDEVTITAAGLSGNLFIADVDGVLDSIVSIDDHLQFTGVLK